MDRLEIVTTIYPTYQDALDYYYRFLKGEVYSCNTHHAPLMDETMFIKDNLLQMNRAGFLTTGSQPGERFETIKTLRSRYGVGKIVIKEIALQREYVIGYIPSNLLLKLQRGLDQTDNGFCIFAAPALTTEKIMVMIPDTHWSGYEVNGKPLEGQDKNRRTPDAYDGMDKVECLFSRDAPFVADLYSVWIIDNQWGRENALCGAIVNVLCGEE